MGWIEQTILANGGMNSCGYILAATSTATPLLSDPTTATPTPASPTTSTPTGAAPTTVSLTSAIGSTGRQFLEHHILWRGSTDPVCTKYKISHFGTGCFEFLGF